MKVNKIQLNQTTFGTTVRMNPELKALFSAKDQGATLNRYINKLKNNGQKDVLSISCFKDKMQEKRILVDVFEVKKRKILTGTTIVLPYPNTEVPNCLNLVQIYDKASKNKVNKI